MVNFPKSKYDLREYGFRNRNLKDLGFDDYGIYLDSELWKNIRQRVRDRDDSTCRVCGERAYQVHHLRYDKRTLLGKDTNWLITLCQECHEEIERDAAGRKFSVTAANRRLEALLAKTRAFSRTKPRQPAERIKPSAPVDVSLEPVKVLSPEQRESDVQFEEFIDIFVEGNFPQETSSRPEEVFDKVLREPPPLPSLNPEIVAAVMQRDRFKCRCCRSRAHDVYGWGDDRHSNPSDLDWLIAICNSCLNGAYYSPNDEPRRKADVDQTLVQWVQALPEPIKLATILQNGLEMIDLWVNHPYLGLPAIRRGFRRFVAWLDS